MLTRMGFVIDGAIYPDYHCTSDGLIAIYYEPLSVWRYYRLNWRYNCYDYVGSTDTYYDPQQAAYDRSEVYPVAPITTL